MGRLARPLYASGTNFYNRIPVLHVSVDMIDILFFGSVADRLGKRSMKVDLPEGGLGLLDLRARLFPESDDRLRMSVNQAVVNADQMLHDGDEVAFFSVFSGG